ncbi:MAG: hypothetical protein WCE75_08115 [Terracidiphilus sp.]
MQNSGSVQELARSGVLTVRSGIGKLRANSFLRNVGIMSSGAAFGHLFTLAAAPLLTRIYGPEEFGSLGLFTTLLSTLSVATTLQYEISIVVGNDEKEAAYLTFGSLIVALPVCALAGVLHWLLIRFRLLGFGGMPWFSPLLLAFAMAFVGTFTALRYWSLREKQFRWIAQATIVQSAARSILQTALGIAGMKASGLLIGETLGRGMGMSKNLRSSWSVLRPHALAFRWNELGQALWRHRKFPLFSFPSSFLDALCLGLPLPLLVHMYGVSLGGYYSLVWKAITVPSVLIVVSVADTFHSSLATCARDTPEQVGMLFRRTSIGLLLAGLLPTALLLLSGPQLFGWIFGSRWQLSGVIAAIIAPWYLAQFVANPLSRVVVVLSGQEIKLIWDVLCLVSLAGVFYAARTLHLAPMDTIKVLSAVYTVLFIVYFLILRQIVARFTQSHTTAA